MKGSTPETVGRTGGAGDLQWLDGPEDGRISMLQRRGRLIAALLLGLLLFLRVVDAGPVELPRLWGFDLQMQMREPAAEPSPVLAVDVDDASLAAFGQWPWPRRHLVDLVDRLAAAGVRVVAFNILFAEEDRMSPSVLARTLPDLDPDLRRELHALEGYDEALGAAMRQVPTVTAVAALDRSAEPASAAVTPGRIAVRGNPDIADLPAIAAVLDSVTPISRSSAGNGIVNLLPEPDGTARRVPTVFRLDDGSLQPSMALDTARVALRLPNMLVEVPSPLGIAGVSVGPLFVPTDDTGRMWVDTADPQRVPIVSAADVLQGRVPATALTGRIVVIGTSAAGLGDRLRIGAGETVTGLQFQALAIDTMVTGRAPHRDSLSGWLELAVTALAGLLLIWWLPRLSVPAKPIVALGLTALAVAGAVYAQIAAGTLVDPTFFSATAILIAGSFAIGDFRAEALLRRRHEVTLKRHDAYIREVVDASFDAIVTIGNDGRIRTANRAACTLLGAAAGVLIGQPLAHRLSGNWAEALARDPSTALRDAAARPDTIEAETLDEAPTEITLAQSVTGAERVYVLVLRDLSARRAAEDWAARSTQRLHDAVDSISDGFALFAPDGRLVRCNVPYREMLDAAVEEPEGTPYAALLRAFVSGRHCPAEARGREDEWVDARLSVFAARSQRYEMETAGGRWYRVEKRRTGEGGMVCIYSDITRIKQREDELRSAMEQAESASLAKSQFLANMSHELRTPLNAIIGFADMLRSEPFGPLGSERYRSYADDISGSGSRLLKMIEQILEFARLERLESRIDESGIDVTATLLAAVTDLTPAARERDIRIVSDVPPSLPALRADPQMLYQIIQNLIANAVKFSGPGMQVRVSARLDDQRRIVLQVEDSGVGIPGDLIEHITQPFWQRSNAMTSSHDGVGLGLAIVSGHVEAHDADLSVESVPDHGTTMTVVFPSYRTV